MLKTAHLLANISKERIFIEWKKLLEGPLALDVITEFGEIIARFFPEVRIPKDIDKEAFASASILAKHLSLFASSGAENYVLAMHRLKTDRATVDAGKMVISSLGKYNKDDVGLAFMLRDLGFENAKLLLECEVILGRLDITEIELLLKVESSGIPYKLSMLDINGNDLLALGFSGTLIGKALHILQEKVIYKEIRNEKIQLMSVAQDIKKALT
jgi:tRNA nucleotidyltransferase/poly(A) polymerase